MYKSIYMRIELWEKHLIITFLVRTLTEKQSVTVQFWLPFLLGDSTCSSKESFLDNFDWLSYRGIIHVVQRKVFGRIWYIKGFHIYCKGLRHFQLSLEIQIFHWEGHIVLVWIGPKVSTNKSFWLLNINKSYCVCCHLLIKGYYHQRS